LGIIATMANEMLIEGLRTKLADIQNQSREVERQLRRLTTDRNIVLSALRLFEEPGHSQTPGQKQRGTLVRSIYETLGKTDEALPPRRIAERLAARGKRTLTPREFEYLLSRVRAALPRLSDKLTSEMREGDQAVYWRIRVADEAEIG
jgi:hypothetical protein